jgi:uncharacterized membrane protein
VQLYLPLPIGHSVFLHELMLWVTGDVADDVQERFTSLVRGPITVNDLRDYDQNSRFGHVVMGEIASRALSPGINDPGTAIEVITRVGRILSSYSNEDRAERRAQDDAVADEDGQGRDKGPDLDRL